MESKKDTAGWQIGQIPDLRELSEVKAGILLGLLKITYVSEKDEQILDLNGRMEELCRMTGMSRHAVYFCLNRLLETGVIFRGRHRGVYIVNPNCFAAGSDSEIKERRLKWLPS